LARTDQPARLRPSTRAQAMSMIGYMGPTVEGVLQAATIEIAIPALSLLLPLWVVARTLRTYHALRQFGTTHLTQGQILALDQSHGLLRRLSQMIASIVIVLGALLIQNGIVRELVQTGMPIGVWWQGL
jgi:hypothetical protein